MATNTAKWRPRLPWSLRRLVKREAEDNGQRLDYKTAELIRKGLGLPETEKKLTQQGA